MPTVFVFALGPWLPKLFPDLLGNRIVATRQEVFYFGAPAGDLQFQPGAMPGWADFNGGDVYYGFPELEGKGVKFAHDTQAQWSTPTPSRAPFRRMRSTGSIAFRDRRFPGLRGAPLIGAEVCQYENSSNGDFLIDRHPTLATSSWSAADRGMASSMAPKSVASPPGLLYLPVRKPNRASPSPPKARARSAKSIRVKGRT